MGFHRAQRHTEGHQTIAPKMKKKRRRKIGQARSLSRSHTQHHRRNKLYQKKIKIDDMEHTYRTTQNTHRHFLETAKHPKTNKTTTI